ncbi:MAG: hypothetical protein M3680_14985 [Myxococcota bacterium]|nr:hypothetical protein [Myxococcota bacterium]
MKRLVRILVWPLLWPLLLLESLGCDDVPQPFDLDHARVMGVQIEPPAIPAEAIARVAVLVTDSTEMPRVAAPAELAITLPAGIPSPELAALITVTPEGWQVQAPPAETLAAIRAALGLAADAELVVPLELAIETADGTLRAQKTITLGASAANPAAPTITLDGAVAPIALREGTDATLGVTAPDPALTYRWFSSVGDLVGFTRAEARVEPAAPGAGSIVLVVRDERGGTAWTFAAANVE